MQDATKIFRSTDLFDSSVEERAENRTALYCITFANVNVAFQLKIVVKSRKIVALIIVLKIKERVDQWFEHLRLG